MKKYNFFKQDAKRPTEEQRLQTKLFYENAGEIYALFDKWKVVDRQAQSPMAMAQRMTGMRICRNDFMAFMLLCKVSEKACNFVYLSNMKLRLLLMSLPILSSLAACTVVEDARITESTKEICDHYSIPYVHLSGIDTQEGHPTVAGMDAIARQVLELITH